MALVSVTPISRKTWTYRIMTTHYASAQHHTRHTRSKESHGGSRAGNGSSTRGTQCAFDDRGAHSARSRTARWRYPNSCARTTHLPLRISHVAPSAHQPTVQHEPASPCHAAVGIPQAVARAFFPRLCRGSATRTGAHVVIRALSVPVPGWCVTAIREADHERVK